MNSPSPSVGVMLPRDLPSHDFMPFARRAEELGFHDLWVVEDLGYRGGIAQAAAVLAGTGRIRVGIGLLPVGSRNPGFAAMEIATLAQLFPGRLDVGVGHGMPDWMRSVDAWPASPLTLLEEYVTAVRQLLRGENVRSDGRYVRLDGVGLEPSALPSSVPDVLAGVRGPKSLAVSGRVADGTVLAEPVAPAYVREAIGHIAPHRPHRIVAYNVASVDADPAVAVAAARPALEWIGDPDWHAHIAPLPFAEAFRELRSQCATRTEFARRMPEAWVAELALAGTPEQVRARLDALREAGVTHSVLAPVGGDPLAALTSLASVL
ncbi:LLM class flavin-dependent oxidoreductase [Streptomyces sp. NPDC048560]|uniref:LLM class flavin-dependent oxidoreductase n=1 Tax=Streptomyces sp. NPDC048560 TaxID=3155488 RepID=UPI0034204FF8